MAFLYCKIKDMQKKNILSEDFHKDMKLTIPARRVWDRPRLIRLVESVPC